MRQKSIVLDRTMLQGVLVKRKRTHQLHFYGMRNTFFAAIVLILLSYFQLKIRNIMLAGIYQKRCIMVRSIV